MSWLDEFSEDLLVPNVTEVCLTGIYASKKNPETTVFVFSDPEDVANNGANVYENIVWAYTPSARLNPNDIALEDGTIKRRRINIGRIQLCSLLLALQEDDVRDVMAMGRDELVEHCQKYKGLCVTCPMTGRVKGKDGNTRVQFKFPDLDFDDPHDFAASVEEQKHVFGYSDLDMHIHGERVKDKKTRPDNAVVPVGADDGDEIL